MSYSMLRENLNNLIKEKSYSVSDVERLAGLKKNQIYNIVKGITQKPSANTLSAIAHVFDIKVSELFSGPNLQEQYLSKNDLELFNKINRLTLEILIDQEIQITYKDIISVIGHILNYCREADLITPDEKFVKWVIKQKISNTLN